MAPQSWASRHTGAIIALSLALSAGFVGYGVLRADVRHLSAATVELKERNEKHDEKDERQDNQISFNGLAVMGCGKDGERIIEMLGAMETSQKERMKEIRRRLGRLEMAR